MPRELGPAPSWELERDSLADRLRCNTKVIQDPAWRSRVGSLASYGISLENVISRAIELTEEDA